VFVTARGPKRPPGETRRLVGELRARGLSYTQIAAALDIGKSNVAYHVRRLGTEADDRFARRYDWAEIQRAYDGGMTVRDCARRFGFNMSSWSQAVDRGDIKPRPKAMELELLLVTGRVQTSRMHLKRRLIAAGIKENRCEICGITEWLDRPLAMQLHHVNGDGHDNRLANLQLLCPNCHSQTDTYGGRNGHRRRNAA
jgi:5-methylcytosine-specific restriction endonuclease McrA